MKMNKRAIELSLSFIVIIIISLVVLAGSMYFIRNLFTSAQETQMALDARTEEELKTLLQGGEIVAVPIGKKTIRIGKQEVFWIGVANVLATEKDFYVLIGFDSAFTPDGLYPLAVDETQRLAAQDYINSEWLLYGPGPHSISAGGFKPISALVNVKPEMAIDVPTKPGIYAFNVCVFNQTNPKTISINAEDCSNIGLSTTIDKMGHQVKNLLYPDGKPRRFIVEVK